MQDEESEVQETQEDPKPVRFYSKIRPLKLAILVGIIAVQVVGAYAVAQFLILPRLPGHGDPAAGAGAEQQAAEEAKAEEAEAAHGEIVVMEDLIVNVTGYESNHFLKVTAGLEFTDPALGQEIEERMPVLRDVLIDHLSNRPLDEVISREGREQIKTNLLNEFNARLLHGELINIYFSNFVVQ